MRSAEPLLRPALRLGAALLIALLQSGCAGLLEQVESMSRNIRGEQRVPAAVPAASAPAPAVVPVASGASAPNTAAAQRLAAIRATAQARTAAGGAAPVDLPRLPGSQAPPPASGPVLPAGAAQRPAPTPEPAATAASAAPATTALATAVPAASPAARAAASEAAASGPVAPVAAVSAAPSAPARDDRPPVPAATQRAFDDARKLLVAGRTDEAVRAFEALAKAHPELGGAHANLALIHRQAGRLKEAAAGFERAVQASPTQPVFHNQLGITYRLLGEFDKARAAYERALEIDADYAAAILNLGILQDLYLWNGARALQLYERYLALAPGGDAKVAKWAADLKNQASRPARPTLGAQEKP